MPPKRVRKRRLSVRAAILVCVVLCALCAFPLIGRQTDSSLGDNSPTLGSAEIELALSGNPPPIGSRIGILLRSPRGADVPIVEEARVRTPSTFIVSPLDVLFLKEASLLGPLGYQVIRDGDVSPLRGKVVKDIPMLKQMLTTALPPAVRPTLEGSRIWVVGEPQMYVIGNDGAVQVLDGAAGG